MSEALSIDNYTTRRDRPVSKDEKEREKSSQERILEIVSKQDPSEEDLCEAVRLIAEIPLTADHERYKTLAAGVFNGDTRDDFTWKWLRAGVESTMLPAVPEEERSKVADAIHKSLMLIFSFDDIADKLQDRAYLNYALSIIDDERALDLTYQLPPLREAYHSFLNTLHQRLVEDLRELDRFDDLGDQLKEDYRALAEGFELSRFLAEAAKTGQIDNVVSLKAQEESLSHTMHIVINGMIMLLACPRLSNPKDEREHIRSLRDFLALDERTGRIINDLETWEEEVKKGQFDSPIVYDALERRRLHHWELEGLVPANINFEFENNKAVSQGRKSAIVKDLVHGLSNGDKIGLLEKNGTEFVTSLSFHIKNEAMKKVKRSEEAYRGDLERIEEEKQQAIDSLTGVSEGQKEALRKHTKIQSNFYKILRNAKEAYAKRG